MSSLPRAHKRRRVRRPTFHTTTAAAEEKYLQQAIQNSKLEKERGSLEDIPYGPVFFPTQQDFEGNPLEYIERIRPVAERYGICKIVPPAGWNPAPFCAIHWGSDDDNNNNNSSSSYKMRFSTKHQMLHRLQEGISFGDGHDYCPTEYLQRAAERTKAWKGANYPDHDLLSKYLSQDESQQHDKSKFFTPANIEKDYWDIVETHKVELSVEYGNDVDTQLFGSGFPLSERGRSVNSVKNEQSDSAANHDGIDADDADAPEPAFGTPEYYRETWWNLNNIPCAPDSVLQHVKVGINGINVPWMYYGSLFTTFCWHNEDNYLYSINYHHKGAPKQWYGVPGSKKAAEGLEKVFKGYLSMKMRDVPDLLHHITTMFSPRLLQNANVMVSKLLQYEGEFVVTFPRSFHGGFSLGPNIGEAVNFATHDWISYGADANERYRSFSRPAVFSHDRLTLTMANHLENQKKYSTCKLLLEELERVVKEELELRHKLMQAGVRDVSDLITLPPNNLEQLDEKSAHYDDRRLCHACKHVCFFSAVACECSQSKVSCIRHAHFMCRCPNERKYFMLWSKEEELQSTLDRVRKHCEMLKRNEQGDDTEDASAEGDDELEPLPEVAPGVERDLAMHKNDDICVEAITSASFKATNLKRGEDCTEKPSEPVSETIKVNEEASHEAEDAVEVVQIRGPNV